MDLLRDPLAGYFHPRSFEDPSGEAPGVDPGGQHDRSTGHAAGVELHLAAGHDSHSAEEPGDLDGRREVVFGGELEALPKGAVGVAVHGGHRGVLKRKPDHLDGEQLRTGHAEVRHVNPAPREGPVSRGLVPYQHLFLL